MMNKFQDLMEAAVPVKVVVDTTTKHAHLKTVEGVIIHVGRNYIEIERAAVEDEKSQHNTEKVRVIIPMSKIAEVVHYRFE
ncbi:MAG: hypothetical protein ACXADS_05880 [Candidatus Thorarchaeota archaeon]|jgi:hypothetical protein